jgi:hypothetical protein
MTFIFSVTSPERQARIPRYLKHNISAFIPDAVLMAAELSK